jgi:hypothetical protein
MILLSEKMIKSYQLINQSINQSILKGIRVLSSPRQNSIGQQARGAESCWSPFGR